MGNSPSKCGKTSPSGPRMLTDTMKRTALHQPIFVSMSNKDHYHTVADEVKANVIPAKSGQSSDIKEMMEFYNKGTWQIPLKNVIDWRHGEMVHSVAHGKDVGMSYYLIPFQVNLLLKHQSYVNSSHKHRIKI